ncbi:MAG: DNA-formamidopyrimidine glycosylase family protein [Mycobacteriaceae bacterium]
MPELPEVENARHVVEKSLQRTIAEIDDRDSFVCRPHAPGEIASALIGGRLTTARRQGKAMWCDTVTAAGTEGPRLGLHLGMGGRIYVSPPQRGGEDHSGGDPFLRSGATDKPEWTRFRMVFDDGGELRLFDKRRLGRVRLEPDIGALGPDAEHITRDQFRDRVGHGTAPIKARLMDQAVLAGIGNLLADEMLWQAEVSPRRPAGELSTADLDDLRRVLRRCIRSAISKGGVHTGEVVSARKADATCPRCGAPMVHGKVGGRTTWWCSAEQAG